MSAEINHKGNLKIEEYEFGAFLQAFQDAILQGYVLDLDSNEHYPQKWGSMMEVTLVSTNFQPVETTEEEFEKSQEVLQEDSPEAIKELLDKALEIPIGSPTLPEPVEEKPAETTTRKQRKNSAT